MDDQILFTEFRRTIEKIGCLDEYSPEGLVKLYRIIYNQHALITSTWHIDRAMQITCEWSECDHPMPKCVAQYPLTNGKYLIQHD